MNGAVPGSTPLAKDSFTELPALDDDHGINCIDTDVDSGALYSAPPTLPMHSSTPFPTSPVTRNSASYTHRSRSSGAGSAGSFADFVCAPPPRRPRRTRGSLLAGSSARTSSNSGSAAGSSSTGPSEGEEDEESSVGTGTSHTGTRT